MYKGDKSNIDFTGKVVLVGDTESGKSTLFEKEDKTYRDEKYTATLGVDFKAFIKEFNGDNGKVDKTKFQVWDTAGQERFRTLTSSYYRGAHNCIICVDFSKKDDWKNVEASWVTEINQFGFTNPKPRITLVATKSDLVKKDQFEQQEALFQQTFGHNPQFHAIFITSAKEDRPEYNFELNKVSSSFEPLENQSAVWEKIFKTTYQHISNRENQLVEYANNTTSNSRDNIKTPKTTLSFNLWRKPKNTSVSPFVPDQNVITVGALKSLCGEYRSGHNMRNDGFWKDFGFTYGSKSMKKLARLCENKNDNVQLTGQDINACLSKHRITALNAWIAEKSKESSSGTEDVIRAIYKHSRTPLSSILETQL